MSAELPVRERPRLITRLVIVNTVVCAIIGGTIGATTWSFLPWLLAGALFGLGVGVLVEAAFSRARHRPRLYNRRMLILVLVEALLTWLVLIPAYAGYSNTHPPRYPVTGSPADLGLDYEDVTLTAADGVTLAGWYIPSQNGAAVIALHGGSGNRTHVLQHAQALGGGGYGVLLFDLRAHGDSGGDRFTLGWDVSDMQAAVAYLQSRPDVEPGRIGAMGLSLGAMVILNAAARIPDIGALWCDGPSSNQIGDSINPLLEPIQQFWFSIPMVWMTDRMLELFSGVPAPPPFRDLVQQIAPRPMVFIAGNDPVELALAERYAATAGDAATLWSLPDTVHVGGLWAYPEEYTARMNAFFDASLPAQ